MFFFAEAMPLDYSLCRDTVTVYSAGGARRVLHNVYFDCKRKFSANVQGDWLGAEFTLIVPGEADIAPGDRVLPGVCPKMALESLAGAGTVHSVNPKFYLGRLCHTEIKGN